MKVPKPAPAKRRNCLEWRAKEEEDPRGGEPSAATGLASASGGRLGEVPFSRAVRGVRRTHGGPKVWRPLL